MKTLSAVLAFLLVYFMPARGQSTGDQRPLAADFEISLPNHPGQLRWHAEGFRIIENSAKTAGQEIGLRGKNESAHLEFLAFLFLVPLEAPLSSAKCRDEALAQERNNRFLEIPSTLQAEGSGNIPVALVSYSTQGGDGKKWYNVRGFVAMGDLCGDMDFYSEASISSEDPELKKIFESFSLDPNYIARFEDLFLYAEILYRHEQYKAAAPIFEQALAKLDDDPTQLKMRRVTTDQAGMSYGISGDLSKARAIFEAAIVKDPGYPLYYYNLACADAEENKLADARVHLQQAFARKENMIPGEKLPDPTKDDSFLPYKKNKDFWNFLAGLRSE
jgi:tetratricopeptide (TPR) repeat protein